MAIDQLNAFLSELHKNQKSVNDIRVAATANEIAEIALEFGYQFSGDELKAASKEKRKKSEERKHELYKKRKEYAKIQKNFMPEIKKKTAEEGAHACLTRDTSKQTSSREGCC